jgi:hypothetical protein
MNNHKFAYLIIANLCTFAAETKTKKDEYDKRTDFEIYGDQLSSF